MGNDIKTGAKQILASYKKVNTYKKKQLLELIGTPTLITDREGMIIDYNSQAFLILGLHKEDWAKQNVYDLLQAKVLSTGKDKETTKNLDLVYQLKGHNSKAQSYFINSYYNSSGEGIHFLVTTDGTNDPTEALLIIEQKYRNLVENATEGIFIIGLQGFYLVNEALCRIFEVDMEEMLKTDPYSLLPHYERDYLKTFVTSRINERILLHSKIEQVFIKPNNENIICEMSYFSTFYNGEYVIQGHLRDISEIKRIEKELEQSEEIYRAVVESAFDNVCIFNSKEVIYANKNLCETIEYESGEVIGKSDFKWIAPEFQKRFFRLMNTPNHNDSSLHFHCVLITKQGIRKTFVFTITTTVFKEQAVFIAVGKDISLKREQEKEKRLTRRKNYIVNNILRVIAESHNSEKTFIKIIKILGLEFPDKALELSTIESDEISKVYSYINKVASITYISSEHYKEPLTIEDIYYGNKEHILTVSNQLEDQAFYKAGYKYYIKLTLAGLDEPFGYFRCAWKNGYTLVENRLLTEIIIEISIALESFLYREKVARITRQTAEAEKNKLLSKFSLIGEMSTAIAHEVRNPMTTVRGLAQLLKEDNPQQNAYYDIMIAEIDRANNTITEFLNLAKNRVEKKEYYNLNLLISVVIDLMRTEALMKEIKIKTNLLTNDIILYIDTELIKLALMNILQNSIDASAAGEIIIINTSVDEGNFIIDIIDEGIGINASYLEHIMEPFFSSKPDKAGLGLSVSYKIIQEHKGDIIISSVAHKGTNVRVTLPL